MVVGCAEPQMSDDKPIEMTARKPIASSDEQTHGEHPHTNRLIHETSPYLLQHAHNPVNWYPWGDEAFGSEHPRPTKESHKNDESECQACRDDRKCAGRCGAICDLVQRP
jgi:hypothetical protein